MKLERRILLGFITNMIRIIELFIKRNFQLILVAIVLFAVLSLRLPPGTARYSYATRDDIYRQLQLDVNPFKIISTTEEKVVDNKIYHVAFLKVHKSGSTTAQNIFLRFGWEHNLTFVLPPAHNPFRYPNIISLRESMTKNNTLPPPPGKHYEMLCNHVIYNREVFRSYMPNDTIYIGILREPYEFFKSTLNYLRPGYLYNKIKTNIPASDYLKNPMKYEPKSALFSFTNNRMAVEFGCPEEVVKSNDKREIVEFVKNIDSDFTLVIIAEHFEESVVLLRRYLRWSTKDILYLDKNIARHKNETKLVGPYDRQMYKRWAKIDYALYEHFFKKLRDQIREEGYDFDDELLHFKEIRRMVSEFCSGDSKKTGAKLAVQKSKWSYGFEVTSYDCDLLKRQEIPFVQDIRFRQYGSRDI